MGERLFYTQEVIGSIPISPTNSRENRYSDGAHNPVSVGSTPTPATKKLEKNLTFLSEAGTIVVKDKRLSNSCFRKWFPFGNVLVPATV